MEELYFTAKLDDERMLFLAPLTDRNIEKSGQEISDTAGYFLYEKRGTDETAKVEIIAHIVSDDAVLRLREILQMT